MKIGIVGWGVEGRSAHRYFGPEHEYLIVNEEPREDFPPESDKLRVQYLQKARPAGTPSNAEDLSYLDGIEGYDKIIYQPTALHNLQKYFGHDQNFWQKAATVNHIFFENVKSKNIIGVTGSKGKGTTSSLIAKLLEAQGKKAHLGGNIGSSMLDLLSQVKPDDWVVLELANFQLKNFPYSPHVAVCLMIVPEHLDWHPDFNDYVESKANIFKHQSEDDIAIYFADNEHSTKIAGYSKGKKIPYYKKPGAYVRDDGMIVIGEKDTEVIPKNEVKLLGEHNLQNICAALTAVQEALGGLDSADEVLSSFSGLEHRLELVRSLDGVKYYNDSFAATPDAAISAIEAVIGNKVMILGGYDRNLPLLNLAQAINKHSMDISKALLMGASGDRLAKELDQAGFNGYEILNTESMDEIVRRAKSLAKAGDSVVLSPGFASFDMFKNFEVRGKKFKESINRL